ncbi:hypothetical protein [uncultured Desulfuromonas sp.]|uniref:Abi-alpha family protein n=1 Tax=uncultured Desulfuromonas sp. TaxID=181013 RepID=UPI002AAAFDE7|nr:hypothetical protein [uncultured Desulfuromonas sp.]
MSDKVDIIKNIPKDVWTAGTDIIKSIVSPVTATTTGIAKLIEQKFSTLNEVQKIYAEQTIKEAVAKVKSLQGPEFSNVVVKPQVLYTVLENTESQSDDSVRDLWSNLTARELSEGSVHPEIVRTLSRLTSPDLVVLSQLYAEESSTAKLILRTLASAYTLGILSDPKSFHHVFLNELGLIERVSGKWFCTTKGKELIRSISALETANKSIQPTANASAD